MKHIESPKKIMQLFREDIMLVTEGGNEALVKEITKELDECEMTNCVLYVRYGPMFLQRLRVHRKFFNDPTARQMLYDEEMWKHHRPNDIKKE